MLRPAYSAIGQHARDGQPAIVFVPTRKHARMAALDLLTHAAAGGTPHKFRQAEEADIAPYLDRVNDAALKHSLRCVRAGRRCGMALLTVLCRLVIVLARDGAVATAAAE